MGMNDSETVPTADETRAALDAARQTLGDPRGDCELGHGVFDDDDDLTATRADRHGNA